jgi:predicted SprT family Zn-dependent metalloprotease
MNSTFLHDDKITPPDEITDKYAPTCEPCGQRMWLTRVETKVGASIEFKKQYECKECGAQLWTS